MLSSKVFFLITTYFLVYKTLMFSHLVVHWSTIETCYYINSPKSSFTIKDLSVVLLWSYRICSEYYQVSQCIRTKATFVAFNILNNLAFTAFFQLHKYCLAAISRYLSVLYMDALSFLHLCTCNFYIIIL